MTTIAYQLRSSRNWPLADTLDMLAKLGIEAVEGYSALFDDPAALKDLLEEYEFDMPLAQVDLAMVEETPDRLLETAESVGLDHVIVSGLPPAQRLETRADWEAFAKRLAGAATVFRDAGIGFGWHTLGVEFAPLADGQPGIDSLVAQPALGFELDLAGLHGAGADPGVWIRKLDGRILAAHITDCTSEGAPADPGYGAVDFMELLPALGDAELAFWVLAHDDPADHEGFATRAFNAVSMFI